MKNIISYLKTFYQATYLPISYYRENQLIFQTPKILGFNLLDCFLYKFAKPQETVNFYATESGLLWGVLQDFATEELIIVGPVCSIRPNRELMFGYMAEFAVAMKHHSEVEEFFYVSPSFGVNQFAHLLSVLNTYINDWLLKPEDFYNPAYAHPAVIEKLHSSLYEAKEAENYHNSFQYEQQMCHYIQEGDIARLKKLLVNGNGVRSGVMGETPIRQEKNKFVAIITLITRYSIYGGLDIETAYQLSDSYLLEAERMPSTQGIERLIHTAILDFAMCVAENKMPTSLSEDVFKCTQFVSMHTNQPLSVKDIAEAVGKSTSLISKKFKKELGVSLSDYIVKKKMEEGKNLLVYSDRSIAEISEYLCFSSQSYFQNVFKKKYGTTPAQYRKEHHRHNSYNAPSVEDYK